MEMPCISTTNAVISKYKCHCRQGYCISSDLIAQEFTWGQHRSLSYMVHSNNHKHIFFIFRYNGVIMDAMGSQITSLAIVYSSVCLGAENTSIWWRHHVAPKTPDLISELLIVNIRALLGSNHVWPCDQIPKRYENLNMQKSQIGILPCCIPVWQVKSFQIYPTTVKSGPLFTKR